MVRKIDVVEEINNVLTKILCKVALIVIVTQRALRNIKLWITTFVLIALILVSTGINIAIGHIKVRKGNAA